MDLRRFPLRTVERRCWQRRKRLSLHLLEQVLARLSDVAHRPVGMALSTDDEEAICQNTTCEDQP